MLTHFPHQNLLFWILFCRMMGAADFFHLILGGQMMCENSEGLVAPPSSLQGKILQTRTLASHPDLLCSSSWLSCGNKTRNSPSNTSLKDILKTFYHFPSRNFVQTTNLIYFTSLTVNMWLSILLWEWSIWIWLISEKQSKSETPSRYLHWSLT